MKQSTHMRIVFWLKAVMLCAFGANLVRIIWRTWKYGGSKTIHEVDYDDSEFGSGEQPGVNTDDDDID